MNDIELADKVVTQVESVIRIPETLKPQVREKAIVYVRDDEPNTRLLGRVFHYAAQLVEEVVEHSLEVVEVAAEEAIESFIDRQFDHLRRKL